ncbi:MAG: RsmE family RNA methyltransferase [Clostridiales bacterium]|nr:RsmE family RNA methyltransferase [Clostridiales bacterium]
MPRFFVAASNIFGGVAYIDSKDAEHLKVLRVKKGEEIIICDGQGKDYRCRVTNVGGGSAEAEIVGMEQSAGEPSIQCRVYAAYPKGDKAETIIQKSVELGAAEIVFFPSERCVSKPDAASIAKKLERWNKISREAAMQSQRGSIPSVRAAGSYSEAINEAASAELPLFLYEGKCKVGLLDAMKNTGDFSNVSIVTGSEGGFSPEEVETAEKAGLICASMGPRILRCETAPLCALSAIMLFSGNL